MRIELPSKMKKETIPKLTHDVFDSELQPKSNYFEFDFKKVDFIEPGGIVALTNIISLLQHKGVNGMLKLGGDPGSKKHQQMLNYLADSHFFIRKFNKEAVKKPSNLPDLLPLEEINFSKIFSWKDYQLDFWLKNNTQSSSSFSNIKTVVEETYNNIKDHSTEDVGCIFGQFNSRKGEFVLCISDFGIGIPNSLKNICPGLEDNELLEKSIIEGVSTRTTPRNRGAGLSNIVRSATKNGIGKVYIMSNYGIIEVENEEIILSKTTNKFYPGTFIEITIDVNNPDLYDSEVEEEFEW